MNTFVWIRCRSSVRLDVRTSLSTRMSHDVQILILTINRDQVLWFDITFTTIYPSRINIEHQLTFCFIPVPDTCVINGFWSQVRIPLIHQVFLTDLLNENQAISSIVGLLTYDGIVETAIQRGLICFYREGRCTSLVQDLNFQYGALTVISSTNLMSCLVKLSTYALDDSTSPLIIRNWNVLALRIYIFHNFAFVILYLVGIDNFSIRSYPFRSRLYNRIEMFSIIMIIFLEEECINNIRSYLIIINTHRVLLTVSLNQRLRTVYSLDYIVRSLQTCDA